RPEALDGVRRPARGSGSAGRPEPFRLLHPAAAPAIGCRPSRCSQEGSTLFGIRPYRDTDGEAAEQIGALAAGWRDAAALRLVAGDPLVGHLQIVDRGTTSTRRQGVCDMYLIVVPEQRRRG